MGGNDDVISTLVRNIRVWDCSTGAFLQPVDKHVVAEDGTEFRFIAYKTGDGTRCSLVTLPQILENNTRFILTRNTGMNDSNGTPIFQGDIVSFYVLSGQHETEEKLFAEVHWNSDGMWSPMGCFDDALCTSGGFPEDILMDAVKWFTVVGNKFEHPQLLRQCVPRD